MNTRDIMSTGLMASVVPLGDTNDSGQVTETQTPEYVDVRMGKINLEILSWKITLIFSEISHWILQH